MFKGDFSSSFFSYSISTFNLAFSALVLASYTSIAAFSLITAFLSSLLLLFTASIYWSFKRIYLETSPIFVWSYCSNNKIFCYLFLSSSILVLSFPYKRTKLASCFLNCFSFYRSLFLCCSLRLVQNSISLCFNVTLAFVYSAFFHVSSSQTTFRSN